MAAPHAAPAGDGPEVSAIVVNWNTADLLDGCLRSLRDHGLNGSRMEVIVVDNGSTDGSADLVRRDWPAINLIANSENLGYTRANNLGITASRGAYLLLINTDALLTPGCLDHLLSRMHDDPRAGAVGPRLVYGDGSWQRWTAGREPSLRAAIEYYFFLERLGPHRPPFNSLYLSRDVRQSFRCDWVTSACMLVRRAALDEIGLMDERFFVYMDDVELCRRLRRAGWHVWYEPGAQAVHFMGQSHLRATGSVSPRALRTFNRYFAMYHGLPAAYALKVIQAIGHSVRAALYGGAALAHLGDADAARAKARAHLVNSRVAIEPRIDHC
jgi:GT2 family glycosyltransferase